jgi:predicted small lipoprotein YifL
VKSNFDLLPRRSLRTIAGTVVLTALLAACGQKGSLYMPAKAQTAAPAKPSQTEPPADENAGPATQ